MGNTVEKKLDFIREKIRADVESGKNGGKVVTRFPPEPNGYLHVGHAKAISLNFGLAKEYEGAVCNLRFDDTNPAKESTEFAEGIQEDIRWLGFDWGDRLYYASDYFQKLYDYAVALVKKGKAYVDHQNLEEIRKNRGNFNEPGVDSPYRTRSVEENLELLEKMRSGAFADGECVLRAKIDMKSPNLNMRDPVIYRIKRQTHYRTGDAWCVYPMYDYAHALEDAIEGVTHSLCSLEFEDHRPLYNWFLEAVSDEIKSGEGHGYLPEQTEFARLNLDYTVMSKRIFSELIEGGHVAGWDDPRMSTIRGMRRRGFTPESLRAFCEGVGVAKFNSVHELSLLEHHIRDDLNKRAPRVMAVLDPIKVVIENFPEGKTELMKGINNPEDESAGKRDVPFTREIYIERDDFREDPPRKFFRLAPGREVRLRYAYIMKCVDAKKDGAGNIVELRCAVDPDSKSGMPGAARRVKGTIHWVSAEHALDAEVRLYDRLFSHPSPTGGKEERDFKDHLNPDSLKVLSGCKVEPSLKDAAPESRYQFERKGYFCADRVDTRPGKPVFNRIVSLRDSWAKLQAKS